MRFTTSYAHAHRGLLGQFLDNNLQYVQSVITPAVKNADLRNS